MPDDRPSTRAERRRAERAQKGRTSMREEAPRLAPTVQQVALSRRARNVGIVMATTMILWVLANLAGRALGLPGRYAILIDLMALAAFIWALVATFRIWQKRRDA